MNEMIKNPLIDNPLTARKPQQQGAMVAVESQRVMTEVQASMIMARANPRNQIEAMDRILNACTRPSLAASAIYSYARGGTDITGPSIRLAEAIAQSWGNIKTSVRELEQVNGVSTIQTIAWDLETGYQCDKIFQVQHVRHTKKGDYTLTDPRDIYENIANMGARRLRACILAVIPGDVVEAAVAQCETTLHATADVSPEGVKKLVDAFALLGISKAQLEIRIQRRIDSIQPAQVVAIRKIYTSIRDGMSSPNDWFESEAGTGDNEDALNKALEAIEKAASKSEIDTVLALIDGLSANDQKIARTQWMAKVKELKNKANKTKDVDIKTGEITQPKKSDKPDKPVKPIIEETAQKQPSLDALISQCQDKDSLMALIATMTSDEVMFYQNYIDENFDSFR